MLWRTLVTLAILSPAATAGENLLPNGDFAQGLDGWHKPWSRQPTIVAVPDEKALHGGKPTMRVEHRGSGDWSLAQAKELRASAGEIYQLSGCARIAGKGDVSLSVTLYDAQHQAIRWTYGARTVRGTSGSGDWQAVQSRFIIPPGAVTILPRWTGNGPVAAWIGETRLVRRGTVDLEASKGLPAVLKAGTPTLEATLHPADGTLTLADRRSGRVWEQYAGSPCYVLSAKAAPSGFDLRVLELAGAAEVSVAIRLDAERPEVTVELSGEGELAAPLGFPQPFASPAQSTLILPVNEGMSYPADDATLRPMHYHLYGGHGLCMGWYGLTDGEAALMALVETPDDAAVDVARRQGRLQLAPQWEPQRGKFGAPRRLRYVTFDRGGYVAMCKRYREYAKQIGLFKTLAEKRKENPNVDRLLGAVNVWCWDMDPVKTCRELRSLGIARILWSNRCKAQTIDELNAMGVLTSRYDIYQDAMDPANFSKLRYRQPDWTSEAWPNDVMLDAQGHWIHGWPVLGKDGQRYDCGVLCDRLAVDYARRRIPAELATQHYACRFIDTTTASPWRECYDPRHPLTRSESKHWKMELLRYISEGCHLVTGSETGHEAAVPYVHYFEGMLSIGPYRVHEAGRNMIEVVDEVPEQVAKFQTGHFYRLPLWELVYHDCVVAQWYWGDYNNKLPKLWDRRDLWNALYGTPPMFMFNQKIWQANRERFAKSYKAATPVARATACAEMLSHRWVTPDHAVQESRFADGTTVTVNFGDTAFTMPDGNTLAPLGQRVTGK